MPSEQALWTTAVAAIELKFDLTAVNDYHTALGQVSELG
jgi:hypothetical protein